MVEDKFVSKQEELQAFLEASEDLINSKYILADIKVVNILKSIASSETILALFKNSLLDFDYEQAKEKYLVKSKDFSGNKGEFILPLNAKEVLAFTFNLLMDIDSKRIDIGEFLNKYFYEDGSYSASFSAFLNAIIKPFANTVKILMTSVIEGNLQDPIEALANEQAKQEKLLKEQERQQKIDKELSLKAYGESVKKIKQILLESKLKLKVSRISAEEKEQILLVIDMFANAIESTEKDAIIYSFVAYRYMAKAHPFLFFNKGRKVGKLLQDVLNEL